MSFRFFMRGKPPHKNAAKPSGNPTLALAKPAVGTASPTGDTQIAS
jgi:hypothetical protein